MKTVQEVTGFLESHIPQSEIYLREGSGGQKLAYFQTWHVNDLLNQCFGNAGWSNETHDPVFVGEGKDSKGRPTYVYSAKTQIKALVLTKDSKGQEGYITITKDGIGTCSGSDREMAIKGAESDSFKRAAVKFGKRLGLALYDRSGEFINDDTQGKDPASESSGGKSEVKQTGTKPPVQANVSSKPEEKVKAGSSSREDLNKLIRSTASVAFAKKALVDGEPWTLDRMKAKISSHGVDTLEKATDEQAQEILEFLQSLI